MQLTITRFNAHNDSRTGTHPRQRVSSFRLGATPDREGCSYLCLPIMLLCLQASSFDLLALLVGLGRVEEYAWAHIVLVERHVLVLRSSGDCLYIK